MSKARRAGTRPESPGESPEDSPLVGSATLFDAMAENAYVLVKRMDPDTKQYNTLGRLEPMQATEEMLAEYGGGGKYLIQEKVPAEVGGFQWGRQRTLIIDGERKYFKGFPSYGKAPASPPSPVPGSTVLAIPDKVTMNDVNIASMVDFLKMSRELTQSQIDSIRQMNQRQTPSWDLEKLIAVGLPLLKELLISLRPAAPPPPPLPPDPFVLMERMAQLVKDSILPTPPEKQDPVEAMQRNIEMMEGLVGLKLSMKELAGDKEEPDLLTEVTKENLPRVLNLMEAEMARRRAGSAPTSAPTTRPRLPASTGPAPEAAVSTTETGMAPWQQLLQARRKNLFAMARDGKDPQICALAMLELQIPASYSGMVREFVQQDDALQLVLATLPELAPYQQWVADFLDAAYLYFFPEEGLEPGEGEEVPPPLPDTVTHPQAGNIVIASQPLPLEESHEARTE